MGEPFIDDYISTSEQVYTAHNNVVVLVCQLGMFVTVLLCKASSIYCDCEFCLDAGT